MEGIVLFDWTGVAFVGSVEFVSVDTVDEVGRKLDFNSTSKPASLHCCKMIYKEANVLTNNFEAAVTFWNDPSNCL